MTPSNTKPLTTLPLIIAFFIPLLFSSISSIGHAGRNPTKSKLEKECESWFTNVASKTFHAKLKAGQKPPLEENQSCLFALLQQTVLTELSLAKSSYGKGKSITLTQANGLTVCKEIKAKYPRAPCSVTLSLSDMDPVLGFSQLRSDDNITGSLQQSFSQSSPPDASTLKSLTPGAGKSGSTFVQTSDMKFILKAVGSSEVENLRKLMQGGPKVSPLRQHFLRENKNSLLNRYYGAYRVNLFHHTWDYILMDDAKHGLRMNTQLADNTKTLSGCHMLTYDLKGASRSATSKHWTSRNCGSRPHTGACRVKKTGINGDFGEVEKNRLHLTTQQCATYKKALQADTKLLEQHKLIDYSLLITRQTGCPTQCRATPLCLASSKPGTNYALSVIDYLIRFGAKKKAESIIKGGKFGNYGRKIDTFFASICP